jgi:ketosteroid isomerase-like protein
LSKAGETVDETAEVVDAILDLFGGIARLDVERIQARYVQEPRLLIFLEGPDSKFEGWDGDANERAWRELLEQVTFTELRLGDDLRAGRHGDLGWVAATVRARYRAYGDADAPEVEVWNRGTWILERHDRWRIVHEHVSFPKDAPYPT